MFKTRISILLAASALVAGPAYANAVTGILTPVIVAGSPTGNADGPPDSPAAHVDPNVPTSPYSGVVSLNIRYDGKSFICSGALIDPTHVLTAGHCIDTNGQGTPINISQPYATSGNDVRVVFNSDPAYSLITASAVNMNPNYQGFGNCPAAAAGNFCVNDDIAIVTLSQPAPADAQIYSIYNGQVATGTEFTQVGYGTSGDGINGYTIDPSFFTKRVGHNIYDLYDLDDEQGFAGGSPEVWYADFDGIDSNGVEQDAFCVYANVCGTSLGNQVETSIGGGDSGGPSFIVTGNGLEIVANNTFSGTFTDDQVEGTFGTYMGGVLLNSYRDWILSIATNAVPEPGMIGLFGLGVAALVAGRRRRKTA